MTFLKLLLITFCILFSQTACNHQETNYPPVDVEFNVIKVSQHVYFVQGKAGVATDNAGFISNAGFIVTDDGVVVFDTLGTPSLAALLYKEIREITTLPIKYVVISHYHADHVYGLQVFKEQGAKILAPNGARFYLASDTAENLLKTRRGDLGPWVNEKTYLVNPDEYLEKNHQFTLGGVDFKITLLGNAHSEGDLTLLVEPDNVLFSGDLIFEGRVPFVGSANVFNWLKALEDMRNIKVAAIIPGHGPLARDPGAMIDLTYGYLTFITNNMQKAVESWTPFDEAYDKIDWSQFESLPAFAAANRKNAFNIYLFMEQNLP